MQEERRLIELEEQFWTGGVDAYRRYLTEDSLMVFPEPVGVQRRAEVIESIERSARWSDVAMDDVRVLRLADGAALLTYDARAHRANGAEYSAHASSIYVKEDDGWKLAFHQQTPNPST